MYGCLFIEKADLEVIVEHFAGLLKEFCGPPLGLDPPSEKPWFRLLIQQGSVYIVEGHALLGSRYRQQRPKIQLIKNKLFNLFNPLRIRIGNCLLDRLSVCCLFDKQLAAESFNLKRNLRFVSSIRWCDLQLWK